MFENPRRDREARNFTTNVPKILDLKSSSEQIFSENWRWVPLISAQFYEYLKLLKAAQKEKKVKQGLEVTAANQLNCYM